MPNPFVKYVLLCLCLIIIYCLYKYPRTRFKKLSQVRNYKFNKLLRYAIKNKIEHIYNIFIITLFTILFTFAIFLLRYYNKNRIIDIKEKYFFIKELYYMTSLYECIINSILFFLLFMIYIWLFMRILKYFKYQVIRRHIYLIGKLFDNNTYENIFEKFYQININKIHYKIIQKLQEYYKKVYYNRFEKKRPDNFSTLSEKEKDNYYMQSPIEPVFFFTKYKEDRILFHLITKWHYMLIFILIFYDLFYNDYQITHVFYVLPWTFFFELYIRFSHFINGLWTPHDQYLNTILYAKQLEIWDKDTLLIDGEFYGYNTAKIIYRTYVARDFKVDPNYM